MSELKVNKVSPRSGTAFTLGDSGDTFTVPSGATLTTTDATVNLPATQTVTTELKTNKISPASGTSFTFGDSGDTFTIPSGATITNSGTATGFGGNTDPFRNLIINGDMSVAQRGTSSTGQTSSGYKTVDRIRMVTGSDATFTVSQASETPTGQGFSKSFKVVATTGDNSLGSSQYNIPAQIRMEGQMLQTMKKGTSSAESVTFSFWVRATVTGTYIVELNDDDNDRYISQSYTISTTNTWEKKTVTFAGDTTGAFDSDNAKSLTINFWGGAGTDFTSGSLATSWGGADDTTRAVGQVNAFASNNDAWQITGLQMELGTSATDFAFVPYDVNFRRCQRYYSRTTDLSGLTGHNFFVGYNTNEAPGSLVFPVTMRAAPTVTLYNSGGTSGGTHRFGVGDLTGVSLSRVSAVGYGTLNKTGGLVAGAYYIGMWEADAEL